MSKNMSEEEILAMVGMTPEQADRNAAIAESEDIDDGLVEPVYYRLHMLAPSDEPMTTLSVRVPQSMATRLGKEAKRYHISRSEYIRRKLQAA